MYGVRERAPIQLVAVKISLACAIVVIEKKKTVIHTGTQYCSLLHTFSHSIHTRCHEAITACDEVHGDTSICHVVTPACC